MKSRFQEAKWCVSNRKKKKQTEFGATTRRSGRAVLAAPGVRWRKSWGIVVARHVDKGSGRCGWFLPCNLSKSINENLAAIYSWCIFWGGDVTLPVESPPGTRKTASSPIPMEEARALPGLGKPAPVRRPEAPKRKLRKSKASVSRCELLVSGHRC